MKKSIWKIAGVNFDHMHMGDLLRMVHEHPNAEIVGICHEDRDKMAGTQANFSIPDDRVYTDYKRCLEETKPDMVILCPATAQHGEWIEKVAPYGVDILMEKPMAASLEEADGMIRAMQVSGKSLVINWPLAWYPPHITTKRLITEGVIGDVIEVHYYDGNRGPLRHVADKVGVSAEEAARQKGESWFYQKKAGGGSLLDYLGYGVTLGTWFHDGQIPVEVTTVVDQPAGLEVDEHSVTVARYPKGLSKYETRWGTFTDPWVLQPLPKCGFVVVGTEGTISSYDYEQIIHLQTKDQPEAREYPVDKIQAPYQNPIQYFLHCLETGEQVSGPLAPAMSRVGQQIVETALLSAREKRTVPLIG